MSAHSAWNWVSLGHMAYDDALSVQQARATALLNAEDDEQTVYSVEHPPTITIGRSGTFNHILASRTQLEAMDMTVVEVDRGGDVTYHGPGQWVVYPVLHLNPWGNDIGRYVRMLEECAILALEGVGIPAQRQEGLPGAWIENQKICAIGARVRRRPSGEFVTSHGLALNVTTDLNHFSTIIPCGITDRGVTSVAEQLGERVVFDTWEERLKQAFENVFA